MRIEKKLLEIGKRDLDSAIILYEAKFYSQAIFSLQQSIEKCVKSYGVKSNAIKEKDLARKINHLPHKVFSRLFDNKLTELKEQKIYKSILPEIIPPHQRNRNCDDEIGMLEDVYNQTKNVQIFCDTSNQEIETLISGANEIDSLEITNEKELYELIKDDYLKTYTHFKDFFSKGKNNEQIVEDIEDSISNPDDVIENLFARKKVEFEYRKKNNYISYVWVNLSIITSPHEQASRYPSSQTGNSPDEFYNEKNILVALFPEMVKLMKNSIGKYEEICFNDDQNQ